MIFLSLKRAHCLGPSAFVKVVPNDPLFFFFRTGPRFMGLSPFLICTRLHFDAFEARDSMAMRHPAPPPSES